MRWILALIALLLANTNELAAQGKGIRLWNLTTATISSFQLSPAGKNAWGANQTLNDKDKEVDHDERLRITGVEPGRYDAKVGYRDSKQCFVRDIEIKRDAAEHVRSFKLQRLVAAWRSGWAWLRQEWLGRMGLRFAGCAGGWRRCRG